MSFNRLTIYGNLGRDPELRYTSNGTPVCNFSVATTEKNRDKEVTTWFRVTFFGKQAEIISQYFTKGKQIYVEGRVSLEKYTDRDGKERVSLEVHGTDVKFIGRAADGERSYQKGEYDQTRKGTDDHDQRTSKEDEDDIPF